MKTIIISPYSKKMRNGKQNPKNFPYWEDVIRKLKAEGHFTIQVGVEGEALIGADDVKFGLPIKKLAELIKKCHTWISVDNFFQHLCYVLGKPGVVIFGRSDPRIFGHELNDNLLKDRSYLRERQFNFWEEVEHSDECFVEPTVVIDTILRRTSNGN